MKTYDIFQEKKADESALHNVLLYQFSEASRAGGIPQAL